MTELTCTLQPGLEQEQEQEEQEHREGGRGGREEEKYDEGELEEVDLALSPHTQRSRRVGSGSKFASENNFGILHDYERQELERRTGLAMARAGAQKEEVGSHSHSCPSQQRDCSLDHATACCLGVACYVAGLGMIALCIYFMIVIFSVIAK